MRRTLSALLLAAAGPAMAQNFDRVEIRVERIAPGVAVLFGSGGNIGLSYGEDGNVIIDDQFAPLTERIVAAVNSVDPDPIRFVINTHWHFDHTGGNENLGKGGAAIVAHDNVRKRMSVDQVLLGETRRASPAAALPVVTFAEGVSFHLNGDTLRVVHVPNAHTDGDALVYWTKANVLHMGDTFVYPTLPFIDRDSGGSVDGFLRAFDTALAMTNAATRIIPGHGAVVGRAELTAYRDRVKALRDRVAKEIAAGRSLEQVQALGLADAFGKPTDFISPKTFIGAVYASLREPPHRHPGAAATHAHRRNGKR